MRWAAGRRLSWADSLQRLRHGAQWIALGTIGNQGSTLLVNVVAAHALGREAYGGYAIVLGTVATLSNVAQLGMGYTATKFLAELRETDQDRAGRVLGLGLLVSRAAAGVAALLLAAGAPVLASEGLRSPQLGPALMIGAGALFFAVVNGFLTGALCGLEAYRTVGYAGLGSGCLYAVICVAAVRQGGLDGLLAGVALSGVFQWGILRRCVSAECSRQGIRVTTAGWRSEWALVSGFAVPAMMSGASYMAVTWCASAMLARRSGGLSEVALLSAAMSFWAAMIFLPSVINNAGMAMLNNRRAAGAYDECRRVFWTTIAVNGILLAAGGGALAAWAPECLRLFGREFAGGAPALRLLVVAAIAYAFWCSVTQVISSGGGMWRVFLLGALSRDVVVLTAAAALVSAWGASGVAAAIASGWTVGLLATAPSALRSAVLRSRRAG